jgi:hypothetical protein
LPAFTYKCLFPSKSDNLFTKFSRKDAKARRFWTAVIINTGLVSYDDAAKLIGDAVLNLKPG